MYIKINKNIDKSKGTLNPFIYDKSSIIFFDNDDYHKEQLEILFARPSTINDIEINTDAYFNKILFIEEHYTKFLELHKTINYDYNVLLSIFKNETIAFYLSKTNNFFYFKECIASVKAISIDYLKNII